MESTRVFLRGLDARVAIERYDGPLYNSLFPRVLRYMCRWETGDKEDFQTMEEWLWMNNITVEKDGETYPKVPLLTADMATRFQEAILSKLGNDFSGTQFIKQMSYKVSNWESHGHIFVSQLVIGVLWFSIWMKSSDNPKEPAALIITDLDLSPVFIPGIVPLRGNEIISYWQTNQFGHPDTIHDILNNKAVVKSLETIREDYSFDSISNALVSLNKLKMYKTKTGQGNLAVPHIILPKIHFEEVKKCEKEFSELADLFISNLHLLDEIANDFYEKRPNVMKMIDYHNYRNMVFLVFSYCAIDEYIKENIFIDGKAANDTKKIKDEPQWKMYNKGGKS